MQTLRPVSPCPTLHIPGILHCSSGIKWENMRSVDRKYIGTTHKSRQNVLQIFQVMLNKNMYQAYTFKYSMETEVAEGFGRSLRLKGISPDLGLLDKEPILIKNESGETFNLPVLATAKMPFLICWRWRSRRPKMAERL
ncbi:hypothetical protein LAZ67_18001782 [Cordylochernes scorpioides]|uniref:Uncharacterized protein n=1 Tax=Cordylochernes scorpioides TaxID=51811 RepID=A0ABY6LIM8_9ARAC|nr:hypothetical protein LAZ67_18001782 [Cordylochernes scorpioides]